MVRIAPPRVSCSLVSNVDLGDLIILEASVPLSLSLSMGSQEVVELEIMGTWWYWRGYRPYDRTKNRYTESPESAWYPKQRRDPMDEAKYSEEQAFPLLKPSIDVFGVPHRSRKQRGWYKVRSDTQASPLELVARYTPQPLRTAADLPHELLSIIANATGQGTFRYGVAPSVATFRYAFGSRSPASRYGLASCAAVSRNWAEVVRPILFSQLYIESYTQMRRLLEIQRSPSGKPLTRSWSPLKFTQQLDDTPFAHIIHLIRMKTCLGSTLVIVGPLPLNRGKYLRSIYGCVPRSLPRSYAPPVSQLELTDIQFRSLMDFVRLIRELRRLQVFIGVRLTWRSGLEESLSPATWRLITRADLDQVVLIGCTPRHRSSALLLAGWPQAYGALGGVMQLINDQLAEADTFTMNLLGRGRAHIERRLRE